MNDESPRPAPHVGGMPRNRFGVVAPRVVSALAAAALVAACTTSRPAADGVAGTLPVPAEDRDEPQGVAAALAYYGFIAALAPVELARERNALSNAPGTPLVLVRRAILLSQTNGGANISRALALLRAVAAQPTPEAIELQPFVRLLSDQLLERQRLEATADRLTQQLERTGQQLKDSQRVAEQLQEKLDALTEIEGMLPARPAAAPAQPLPTSPRRPPR